MRRLPISIAALLVLGGCQNPALRVPAGEEDAMQSLAASPLLVDLPPEEPVPELHASGGSLNIADAELFSLSFRDTPLRLAIDNIAARAAVTVITDPGVDGLVNVDFVDIRLDDALLTLLKQHELVLLPGPGNVYFIERNDDPTQVTEFIQLVNVHAAEVSANLQALVGEGSKVIVDTDRNLVCLVGRQSDVAAVRRYLHHVDTLKDQVLIEVHIFEVSYEDGFQFGSRHDSSGSIDGDAFDILSTFGQGSAFNLTLTDGGGDFSSTIDAMRTFVGLELVSSPRVLAVTNTQSVVDVVKEIPYIETTSTTTGTTAGVGSTVQESVKFKEAGIRLQITPSIQEAGYLQVAIEQSIIEEVERFNDIPVVDRRTIVSQFLVKDRNTIVLGGLIQERQSESRSGIPVLMHIPILGQLFRGDADLKKKQELLVFVTPRILSPRQAAELAPHYQDQYRESRRGLHFPMFGEKQ
jgi:type II secretory pathway component GspD/PulD (secretin)